MSWQPRLVGRRSELSELCGGFLDDLAAVIRSAAAVRGSAPVAEPPRLRLLEGLAVLVANLSRRLPLVVFVDDAHVADASSWEASGTWDATSRTHGSSCSPQHDRLS